MPSYPFAVESPVTGQTWNFTLEGEGEPSLNDIEEAAKQFDDQWFRQQGKDPAIGKQTPLETFGNRVSNIGPDALASLGGLADLNATIGRSPLAAISPLGAANQYTKMLTGFDPLAYITDQTKRIQAEGELLRPTNPANETANTLGSAVNQVGAMLASGGTAVAAGMPVKVAMGVVPQMIGFGAGADQGLNTAREMGITDPTAQAALGMGFGGVEALTEKLGGIGGDMLKPAKTLAGKLIQNTATESGEEVLAGRGQDALTLLAAQGIEDPDRPGFTKTGFELPSLNPLDPRTLDKMKQEAIGGAAGGVLFSGLSALPSAPQSQMAVDAAEVVAQRARPPESAQKTAGPTPETNDELLNWGRSAGLSGAAVYDAAGFNDTDAAASQQQEFALASLRSAKELQQKAAALGQAISPQEAEKQEQSRQQFDRAIRDTQAADAAYDQLPESQGGKIISTDLARSLNPDYAAPVENGALRPYFATDGPAAAYMNDRLSRELQNRGQRRTFLLAAGGWGAGKSHVLARQVKADLTLDGTVSDPKWAASIIQKALDNGWQVVHAHVQRPFELVGQGVVERAIREGRAVPLAKAPAIHRASLQTALAMRAKFGPRIESVFLHNAGTAERPEAARELTLDDVSPGGDYHLNESFDVQHQQIVLDAAQAYASSHPVSDAIATATGLGSRNRGGSEAQVRPASASDGNGGPGASSLKEWSKTTFGQRLKTDERLRSAWRETIGGQYRVESEAEWQATANRFIEENGPADAFALMTDPDSGLADSDRVAIGLQLILSLDAQIREFEAAGDSASAADLDDLLYETAQWIELKGTKLGQAVRVFGMWTRMSAEGVLRAFERQVAEARENDLQTRLGTDPAKLAADITTAAAEERADTAAEALGETTADQLAELRQQVAELRQQLAQATQEASAAQQESAQAATPADAAQASQKVRKAEAKRKQAQRALTAAEDAQQRKASEAGKPRPARQRKPRVLNPEDLAARLIARLAQTPDQREARRKKAVNEVQKLATDYTAGRLDSPALQAALEALGVDPDTAARLIQLLHVEKAAQQTRGTDQPPKRQPANPSSLAWQWIDRLTFRHLIGGPPEPARAAGALAQLIRAYIKAPDAASLPDFNAEARALGLDPAEAVELQRMLDLERASIAAIAQERAINRLVNQLAPKLPTTRDRMPRFLKKLFDAHELGALDRPDFLKAYAEAFEMPVMDDATRKRIKLLIDAQRAAPESYLKQQATTALMAELSMFKGIPALDIFTAFWYANVLSGLTTQGVNVFGNAAHLMLKTLTVGATHNPRESWQFMRGLFEGARRGAAEAKAALQEGSVPYRTELNFTQGQVLELIHSNDPGTWAKFKNLASLGKWVFRALQAGDAFFYHTAREGRAWLEASRYASTQQKLNGGNFGQYMAEQLANGPQRLQQAIAQAKAELAPSGRDTSFGHVDRRAWEIMEANRPADLNQKAARFGTLTTFTQEPEGTMGAIAGLINEAHRRLSIPSPWGSIRVLTPFIPFVNIVANVTSTALDFTPVGIARGAMGRHVRNALDKSQKDFDSWESRQRIASGMLGTLGTGMLLAFAMAFRERDDDEVPFMIYGMGPGTKARRDQMPKGWKPYVIKIGDSYISYAETPLSLVLAIAGGAMDYLRYNPKGREDHAMGAMAYALGTSPQALLKTGVLSSLNDLFSLMEGERSWSQVGTRTASGFIPGQALLRDIAELFEGDKIDDTTVAAGLLKDVPIIRGLVGKPALNVFGEPVHLDTLQRLPIMKRLITRQGEDKDTLWMARNKLWMPGIDNQVELGTYLTEEDKMATQGAAWRADRLRQLGRAAADVLTPEERYRLIQFSGPGLRQAIEETRQLKVTFPEITREQLQERLNAKIVAQRRLGMKRVLGL